MKYKFRIANFRENGEWWAETNSISWSGRCGSSRWFNAAVVRAWFLKWVFK